MAEKYLVYLLRKDIDFCGLIRKIPPIWSPSTTSKGSWGSILITLPTGGISLSPERVCYVLVDKCISRSYYELSNIFDNSLTFF